MNMYKDTDCQYYCCTSQYEIVKYWNTASIILKVYKSSTNSWNMRVLKVGAVRVHTGSRNTSSTGSVESIEPHSTLGIYTREYREYRTPNCFQVQAVSRVSNPEILPAQALWYQMYRTSYIRRHHTASYTDTPTCSSSMMSKALRVADGSARYARSQRRMERNIQ